MANAQTVFETAMHLLDETNEKTGSADYSDTREYKNRTLAILNTLIHELYPISDNFQNSGKIRPVPMPILTFEQLIDLDDGVSLGILPFGLAGTLMLDENPAISAYLLGKYEELIRMFMRRSRAESGAIKNLYGRLGV